MPVAFNTQVKKDQKLIEKVKWKKNKKNSCANLAELGNGISLAIW